MGRRRKDADWIELVVKLGGLVLILSLISPGVRQAITGIGLLFLLAAVIAVVVLIGFAIYKHKTRSKTSEGHVFHTGERPDPQLLTADDLLKQLRTIDWFQFEKLVELAYLKLGYEVTRKGGANPDGGIDLIILKDGQTKAVQCKQWKTWNVGVRAVREFLGALKDSGIEKGIFITLNGYTGEAKLLADKHGIEIINEIGLAEMLETVDAKSSPDVLSLLNDTRKYCPKCESEMILRTATKGLNAGGQFWGCSRYPRCRFTMQVV
jgi:restriction system protein